MTIIDDRIAENSEQHFIGVLNFVREDPPGASLSSNTAILTILDNNDCKFLSQVGIKKCEGATYNYVVLFLIQKFVISLLYFPDAIIRFESLLDVVDEQDVDFVHNLVVTRNIESEQNYSITLRSSSITAEDDDYSVLDNIFYFPPDVSSINVPVTIHGDTRIELVDIFEVTLRSTGVPVFVVDRLTRTTSVGIIDNDGGETNFSIAYLCLPEPQCT